MINLETIAVIVSICVGIISIILGILGIKNFMENQPSIYIRMSHSSEHMDITITNSGNKIVTVTSVSVEGMGSFGLFFEDPTDDLSDKPRKIDVGESVTYHHSSRWINHFRESLAKQKEFRITVQDVTGKTFYGYKIYSETLLRL